MDSKAKEKITMLIDCQEKWEMRVKRRNRADLIEDEKESDMRKS